ncbi:hypothetical protein BCR44DRAFT_41198, partial [Catenaria anguillulae PL171]
MMGTFGGISGGGIGGNVGLGLGLGGGMPGFPPVIPAATQSPQFQFQQPPGAQLHPPAFMAMFPAPQPMQSHMPGVRPPAPQQHFAASAVAQSHAGLPPRPRPPNPFGTMYSNTFHPIHHQQRPPQPTSGSLPPRPAAPATPQFQPRPPGAPYDYGFGNNYPGYQGFGGGNGQGW